MLTMHNLLSEMRRELIVELRPGNPAEVRQIDDFFAKWTRKTEFLEIRQHQSPLPWCGGQPHAECPRCDHDYDEPRRPRHICTAPGAVTPNARDCAAARARRYAAGRDHQS